MYSSYYYSGCGGREGNILHGQFGNQLVVIVNEGWAPGDTGGLARGSVGHVMNGLKKTHIIFCPILICTVCTKSLAKYKKSSKIL